MSATRTTAGDHEQRMKTEQLINNAHWRQFSCTYDCRPTTTLMLDSPTAWVVSIVPWVRTHSRQLWRGTDGFSKRRVG